jgi:outer membrane protein assembly factor BamA
LDIRDKQQVDTFTDRREYGQFAIGATLFKNLEISAGYRTERIRISGGLPPNRLAGSKWQAGITFRLNRDTLDAPDFPRSGMLLRAQFDRRHPSFGGDVDYSKWQFDYQRFFHISANSIISLAAAGGYTRGNLPFYDRFFIGGSSFLEIASRRFPGLRRDELAVRQMGILGAGYRRQLFSSPLAFVRRGFLTGSYSGVFSSARQSSPYDFDLMNGVGIGLALETLVGPFRISGGWAEGGRFNYYISFGPSF